MATQASIQSCSQDALGHLFRSALPLDLNCRTDSHEGKEFVHLGIGQGDTAVSPIELLDKVGHAWLEVASMPVNHDQSTGGNTTVGGALHVWLG
jgi:hypothetical protein